MARLTFTFGNSDPYTTGPLSVARAERCALQMVIKVEKNNPGQIKKPKIKEKKTKRLNKHDDTNLLKVDVT